MDKMKLILMVLMSICAWEALATYNNQRISLNGHHQLWHSHQINIPPYDVAQQYHESFPKYDFQRQETQNFPQPSEAMGRYIYPQQQVHQRVDYYNNRNGHNVHEKYVYKYPALQQNSPNNFVNYGTTYSGDKYYQQPPSSNTFYSYQHRQGSSYNNIGKVQYASNTGMSTANSEYQRECGHNHNYGTQLGFSYNPVEIQNPMNIHNFNNYIHPQHRQYDHIPNLMYTTPKSVEHLRPYINVNSYIHPQSSHVRNIGIFNQGNEDSQASGIRSTIIYTKPNTLQYFRPDFNYNSHIEPQNENGPNSGTFFNQWNEEGQTGDNGSTPKPLSPNVDSKPHNSENDQITDTFNNGVRTIEYATPKTFEDFGSTVNSNNYNKEDKNTGILPVQKSEDNQPSSSSSTIEHATPTAARPQNSREDPETGTFDSQNEDTQTSTLTTTPKTVEQLFPEKLDPSEPEVQHNATNVPDTNYTHPHNSQEDPTIDNVFNSEDEENQASTTSKIEITASPNIFPNEGVPAQVEKQSSQANIDNSKRCATDEKCLKDSSDNEEHTVKIPSADLEVSALDLEAPLEISNVPSKQSTVPPLFWRFED